MLQRPLKLILGCATAILTLLASDLAHAEWLILAPTFHYREKKDELSPGGSSKESVTIFDIRIGTTVAMNLFIGGIYNKETTDSGGGITEKVTGAAPTVGYWSDGFYVLGSYFLMGEREKNSGGSKLIDKDGSGMQIDFGYQVKVGPAFGIAPQFTWRSMQYDKQTLNGVDTNAERKVTEIRPMISLIFSL